MNKMVNTLIAPVRAVFYYFYRIKIRKYIVTKQRAFIGRNVKFEGNNVLYKGASITGDSSIGYGTYVGANSQFYDVEIGKFCSIGSNVTVLVGRHPTCQFVSTHPCFFSLKKQAGFTYCSKQKYDENRHVDKHAHLTAKIGNDVWIGSNAVILEGVVIGDGAIIGAGAYVRNDVPPYAIVTGNPAKITRFRFSEIQIEKLLKIRWWEKPLSWIEENADHFDNIEMFCEKWGREDEST